MTSVVTSLPAEGAEASAGASAAPTASKAWVAAATKVGTTIEWYDFFIFGTATALVFDKLFFPAFDPVVATLASFSTFAVGLFARPLGALVFGHFGDRVGRKRMLVASLLLMGVPTTLIGLVPTYEQIGLWAAVMLVTMPLCGWLSDKVGSRVLFGVGAVVLAALAIPMFLLIDTRDPTAITLAIACALGAIYPLMYAPEASFFASLFPTAVRYTGLSISAHVGGAVGGGLAPIVAASLLASCGNSVPVGIYLGGLACLAVLCVLLLKPAEEPRSP